MRSLYLRSTPSKLAFIKREKDKIVPVNSLLEAKEFFIKNNYQIESHIFKDCEHRIPTEGSSLGLQFIKNNFN